MALSVRLKHLAFGLLAFSVIFVLSWQVATLLVPRFHPFWTPTILVIRLVLSCAAGAYFSRGHFLLPAALIVLIGWVSRVFNYAKYSFPEEQVSLVEYAIIYFPNLAIGLLVVLLGTYLGNVLYRLRNPVADGQP